MKFCTYLVWYFQRTISDLTHCWHLTINTCVHTILNLLVNLLFFANLSMNGKISSNSTTVLRLFEVMSTYVYYALFIFLNLNIQKSRENCKCINHDFKKTLTPLWNLDENTNLSLFIFNLFRCEIVEETECETVMEKQCRTEMKPDCSTIDKAVCTSITEPVCSVFSEEDCR